MSLVVKVWLELLHPIRAVAPDFGTGPQFQIAGELLVCHQVRSLDILTKLNEE
jgi:hypothetical protein